MPFNYFFSFQYVWSGSQALLQTISCMKVVGRLCAGGQAVVKSEHRFEENVIKLTKSTWVKAHNVYLIQIFFSSTHISWWGTITEKMYLIQSGNLCAHGQALVSYLQRF